MVAIACPHGVARLPQSDLQPIRWLLHTPCALECESATMLFGPPDGLTVPGRPVVHTARLRADRAAVQPRFPAQNARSADRGHGVPACLRN